MERPKAAIRTVKTALNVDSTFREGLRWLGIAYYTAHYRDSALVVFERLLHSGDLSTMVHRYLGMLYYQNLDNLPTEERVKEECKKIEYHLLKVLKDDPKNIDVLYILGSTYRYLSEPDKGLYYLAKLDTVFAKNNVMKAYNEAEKGRIYVNTKQYNKAIQCHQKARQLAPEQDLYLYEIAMCYDLSKNRAKAIEWYRRFLEKRDPEWEKRNVTTEASYENVALGRYRKLIDESFEHDEL